MFGNYFKHVLILTLLAGLTYSLPQVKDAMAGAFDISYAGSSAYTAAAGDLMKVASGPVTVKEVRGKVGYDSKHQESSININAKVQITATGDTMYIPVDGFSFTLRNKTLNIDGGYARSSVVTSNLPMDTKGTYTLKSGTTALFTVTASANPKSMIAGQYTASLTAVVTDNNKIQPPANSSNTFVVVGESSPYITLVGQGLYGSKDTLVLNSVRLGRNPTITFKPAYDICEVGKVCPPSAPQTFSLRGSSNTKHVKFDLSNKNLKPAQYQVYVTNTELGETSGKSNIVMIQILDQSKILTAKVIAGKLALAYDSNNKESSLSAPFEITIKAGKEDIVLDDGAFSVYADTNGTSVMNAQVQIKSINSQTVSLPYILKAGKEARIMISASVNPKILQAGSYSMSLNGVYTKGVYIQVNQNETNSVVIVGEVSPYITSVNPNPAIAGQPFSISGQRLAGAQIFIDGTALTTSVAGAVDGTLLSTILPTTLQDGFHMLYVRNNLTGQSNNFWFESVGGPVQASTITIISPNGGEIYKVKDIVDIKWSTTVSSDTATIWLSDKYGSTVGEIKVPTPNTGNYSWTIPENIVPLGTSGAYKIFMNISSNSTGEISSDYSDNYFTILGASTSTCYAFTTNLAVGSTGPDVVALQSFLSSHGFQGSGSFQSGTFDDSTMIALMAFQTSSGLPATGSAGPLTRALLNACVPPSTTCPAGYVCVPGTPTEPQPVNCPVGYTCTVIVNPIVQPTISNTSASKSTLITDSTGTKQVQNLSFNFTITAANSPVYISKSVTDTAFLDKNTSIVFGAKGYLVPTKVSYTSSSVQSGDTSSYFLINPGTSRDFSYTGMVNNSNWDGYNIVQISGINYGTDSVNLSQYSISSGLENLKIVSDITFGTTTVTPTTTPIKTPYIIPTTTSTSASMITR